MQAQLLFLLLKADASWSSSHINFTKEGKNLINSLGPPQYFSDEIFNQLSYLTQCTSLLNFSPHMLNGV